MYYNVFAFPGPLSIKLYEIFCSHIAFLSTNTSQALRKVLYLGPPFFYFVYTLQSSIIIVSQSYVQSIKIQFYTKSGWTVNYPVKNGRPNHLKEIIP